MKNKKFIGAALALTLVLTGCGDSGSTTIAINGSTSAQDLFEKTYDPQIKTDLGLEVQYQATGSSDGIKAAEEGTADFGTSSRELTDDEASKLDSDVLAYDGIALVTNKDNPVQSITSEQATQIFEGKITNWKQLGGNDADIVVVSREDGSGTRSAIEELLGFEGNLVEGATIANGNGNVASTVAENPNAIGYTSFLTLDDNSEKINGLTVDGAEPTPKAVLDKSYPLSRPFLIVYQEENLTENDKKVLDWIDETGKGLAPDAGLIEVTE